jgi:hypothetical protein
MCRNVSKLPKLGLGFQLRIHEMKEQEVITYLINNGRSQWLRGLWSGFAAAILLGLRVRILHGAWTPVSCECFMFSRRSLSDGLIRPTEESYRVCMCH